MVYAIGAKVCHFLSRSPTTVVKRWKNACGDIKYLIRTVDGQEVIVGPNVIDPLPEVGDRVLIAVGDYSRFAKRDKFKPLLEQEQEDMQWICQEFTIIKSNGNTARIQNNDKTVERNLPLSVLRVLRKQSEVELLQPSTRSLA